MGMILERQVMMTGKNQKLGMGIPVPVTVLVKAIVINKQ
jgi:hypothetical protein